MDEETNNLIARWYLSELNYSSVVAREFADWAVLELENGRDSKNLCILASEFNARAIDDVEDHFRRSLQDLGWDFPTKKTAINRYADNVISQIAKGQVEPFEGCRELKMMWSFLDYPQNLSNWNSLFWASEEILDDELDVLIVDEARRLLAGEPSKYEMAEFVSRLEIENPVGVWERIKNVFS